MGPALNVSRCQLGLRYNIGDRELRECDSALFGFGISDTVKRPIAKLTSTFPGYFRETLKRLGASNLCRILMAAGMIPD